MIHLSPMANNTLRNCESNDCPIKLGRPSILPILNQIKNSNCIGFLILGYRVLESLEIKDLELNLNDFLTFESREDAQMLKWTGDWTPSEVEISPASLFSFNCLINLETLQDFLFISNKYNY